MSIDTGTVYMIDPNTGKQTPISHISDAEITCDTESTDMLEIDALIKARDKIQAFFAELQMEITSLSEAITKIFYPPRLTNNYVRMHGGRAIRWRKIK